MKLTHLSMSGFFCDEESQTCTSAGLPGFACKADVECFPGLACVNKKCVVIRMPGDPCKVGVQVL